MDVEDLVNDLRQVATRGARPSVLVSRAQLLNLRVVDRRSSGSRNNVIRAGHLAAVIRDAAHVIDDDRLRAVLPPLLGLAPFGSHEHSQRMEEAAARAGYSPSYLVRPEIIRELFLAPLARQLLRWDDPRAEELDLGVFDDPGIIRYFNDIVSIPPHEWAALFAETETLDLFMNYGATWRNTYLKELEALLERQGSRIRLVLPDTSANSALLRVLADRHRLSRSKFRDGVLAARNAFSDLNADGAVEIFETEVAFHHAVYIFSSGAVIALYALTGERVPTPAIIVGEGGLLEFVRSDFDGLVNAGPPRCRQVFP